jgi:hypothetical protein
MPFNCPSAEEQLGADLRVGAPVAGQARDLRLLRRELILRFDVRLRTRSPVARSSWRARSPNASMPIARNESWAGRS